MSKYTTEVRYICENYAGLVESKGYSDTKKIINDSRAKVFDFSYPIFDEAYRPVLETKILKHFYTREIGAESVGLWKMWLDTRMNEIMPYYNQLYKSELLEFNPLYDVDLTTDHKKINEGTEEETGEFTGSVEGTFSKSVTEENESSRNESGNDSRNESGDSSNTRTLSDTVVETGKETTTGSGTSETSTNSSGSETGGNKIDRWDYYSDTPQGGITGLANMDYLTNARHTVDDGSASSKSTSGISTTDNEYSDTSEVNKTGNKTDNATETNVGTTSNEIAGEYSKEGTDKFNKNGSESGVDTTNTNNRDSKNSSINSTEDYLEHVKGKTAGTSYSKLLQEYRQTFINIDMQVINELNDLFMNLW